MSLLGPKTDLPASPINIRHWRKRIDHRPHASSSASKGHLAGRISCPPLTRYVVEYSMHEPDLLWDRCFGRGGAGAVLRREERGPALECRARTYRVAALAVPPDQVRGRQRGMVERREAPHPYVTGVRAPSQRRAAGRVMVRQGALADAPGASRRSISLVREGDGKRGKGDARRPKSKCPGGVALAV